MMMARQHQSDLFQKIICSSLFYGQVYSFSKDLPHQYRVLIDMRGEKAIDRENIVYIYGDKQEIFYLGVLNDISERNSSVEA